MGSGSVLLVFDDTAYALEIGGLFEARGIRPIVADSIRKMTAHLRRHPCDLLVTPVSECIDCMAVQKRARRIRPGMTILVLADRERAGTAVAQCLDLLMPNAHPVAGRRAVRTRMASPRVLTPGGICVNP